jgi:hypothetical protein
MSRRSRFTCLAILPALLGLVSPPAARATELFAASLRGNVANQEIAGFPSSVATWDLQSGSVALFPFGRDHAVLVVRTRGLIIPDLGRNPSPDLLARLVCHDEAGAPSEAARTRAIPFPQSGTATLVEVIPVPPDCYAPIVLLTGSADPEGQRPGKFFAVSGF